MPSLLFGSICGFVLVAVAAALFGLIEPIWFGEGVMGFAFLLIVFAPGLVISCVLLRRGVGESPLGYGLVFGGLGFLITYGVTALLPGPIKATIHAVATPPVIVGLEIAVTAAILCLAHFIGLRIASRPPVPR